VEIVRLTDLVSFAIALTPMLMLVPWAAHANRAQPARFWWIKGSLILGSLALLLPITGIMNVSDVNLGTLNMWTGAMFVGTVMQPAATALSLFFLIDAWRCGAGRWLRGYAATVSLCGAVVTAYLAYWSVIAFRPWNY